MMIGKFTMFRIIMSPLIILILVSCANTTTNNDIGIYVPCEVESEYGTIGCGTIPLSTNNEVNKKFKEICFIKNKEYNLQCLNNNKNNPLEAYKLGNIKYFSSKNQNEVNEGINLIEYSAKNQYPEALLWLSKYYQHKGDLKKSFTLMEEAANLENPLAIYGLGYRYNRGLGIEKDSNKAINLLNISKNYVPVSYSEIASIHLNNGDIDGFIKNSKIAKKNKYWFANVDLAILALGQISGAEQYKNIGQAKEYAEELISNQIPVGYFINSQVLEIKSNGLPESKICENLKKSYVLGFLPAGINLSNEYIFGHNCNVNYKEAFNILENLYLSDLLDIKIMAAANLGYIYANGLGVDRNITIAKKYLNYAINNNYQPALETLKAIE